jgi:hypothetical protein
MRRKTFWQRRRESRLRAAVASVPDVVRSKADAEQQMRFYDQLGERARLAARETRFDTDATARWREGFVRECSDAELAEVILREDAKHSGRFGPPASAGI